MTRYINRGTCPVMFEGVGIVQPGSEFDLEHPELIEGFNAVYPGAIELAEQTPSPAQPKAASASNAEKTGDA